MEKTKYIDDEATCDDYITRIPAMDFDSDDEMDEKFIDNQTLTENGIVGTKRKFQEEQQDQFQYEANDLLHKIQEKQKTRKLLNHMKQLQEAQQSKKFITHYFPPKNKGKKKGLRVVKRYF